MVESLPNDYLVSSDETRILFLKLIEQTIRDYNNLKNSKTPIEIEYWQTANDFLFDSEYRIVWGSLEISIGDILDYLQLDRDWFYRKLEENI